MNKAKSIVLVAARASNGVIGNAGAIPWQLSTDLTMFRKATDGKVVLMGRKTWVSLGGKPLAQRKNIVLSNVLSEADVPKGVLVHTSLWDVCEEGEVFVIGGSAVYKEAEPLANKAIITEVHAEVEGDTVFPPLGEGWVETQRQKFPAGPRDQYPFDVVTYERKAKPAIITIDMAESGFLWPGGDLRKYGPGSGEAFRDDLLIPAFALKPAAVVLRMDSACGFGGSWLHHVFSDLEVPTGTALVIQTRDSKLREDVHRRMKAAPFRHYPEEDVRMKAQHLKYVEVEKHFAALGVPRAEARAAMAEVRGGGKERIVAGYRVSHDACSQRYVVQPEAVAEEPRRFPECWAVRALQGLFR